MSPENVQFVGFQHRRYTTLKLGMATAYEEKELYLRERINNKNCLHTMAVQTDAT